MSIIPKLGKKKANADVVDVHEVEQEQPQKRINRVSRKDLLRSNIKETNWPNDIATLVEVCAPRRVGRKNVCFDLVRVKKDKFGNAIDQNVHLAFAFYTDDVGGLSVNAVKAAEKAGDESKGELVQQMNDGVIKIMATEPMLEDNMVVIMPEEATIAALNEFRFMRSVGLTAMYIADSAEPGSGGVIICDSESYFDNEDATAVFTLEDILRVFSGASEQYDVRALLASRGVSNILNVDTYEQPYCGGVADEERIAKKAREREESLGEDRHPQTTLDNTEKIDAIEAMDFSKTKRTDSQNEKSTVSGVAEEYVRSVKGQSAEVPQVSNIPVKENISTSSDTPTMQNVEISDSSVAYNNDVTNSAQVSASTVQESVDQASIKPAENTMQAVAPAPTLAEREVPVSEVENTVNSIVYNGRQYVLDIDAFDRRFCREDTVSMHSEDRPRDVWLNNYINEMARQFNDDLAHVRDANIAFLYTYYVKMMSSAVQAMEEQYRLDSEENPFGKNIANINRQYKADKLALEKGTNDRINNLKKDYNAEKKAYVDREIANLSAQYDARHKMELDEAVRNAEAEELAILQSEYEYERTRIYQVRGEVVAMYLSRYQNTLLDSIQATRERLRAKENELFEDQKNDLRRYVNNHRKEQVDIANMVSGQQVDKQRIEDMKRSHEAELEKLERENRLIIDRLQDENKGLIARHQSEIESMKLASAQVKEDSARTVVALENRVDELIGQVGEIEATKSREYESRLYMLNQQKEASDKRYEAMLDENKRRSVMFVAFIVVAAIAAGCVGLVVGLNQAYDMTNAIDAVIAGSSAAGVQANIALL